MVALSCPAGVLFFIQLLPVSICCFELHKWKLQAVRQGEGLCIFCVLPSFPAPWQPATPHTSHPNLHSRLPMHTVPTTYHLLLAAQLQEGGMQLSTTPCADGELEDVHHGAAGDQQLPVTQCQQPASGGAFPHEFRCVSAHSHVLQAVAVQQPEQPAQTRAVFQKPGVLTGLFASTLTCMLAATGTATGATSSTSHPTTPHTAPPTHCWAAALQTPSRHSVLTTASQR